MESIGKDVLSVPKPRKRVRALKTGRPIGGFHKVRGIPKSHVRATKRDKRGRPIAGTYEKGREVRRYSQAKDREEIAKHKVSEYVAKTRPYIGDVKPRGREHL